MISPLEHSLVLARVTVWVQTALCEKSCATQTARPFAWYHTGCSTVPLLILGPGHKEDGRVQFWSGVAGAHHGLESSGRVAERGAADADRMGERILTGPLFSLSGRVRCCSSVENLAKVVRCLVRLAFFPAAVLLLSRLHTTGGRKGLYFDQLTINVCGEPLCPYFNFALSPQK